MFEILKHNNNKDNIHYTAFKLFNEKKFNIS